MTERQDEQLLSRRAAISIVTKSPFSLFFEQPLGEQAPEEVLSQCANALALCWQGSKGQDLHAVEQVLPTYIQRLEQMAQHVSKRQPTAAHFASQGYQLAGILVSHRNNLVGREIYCRRGVQWARIADDPSLLVSAFTKLGGKFYYTKQPELALQTYKEALPVVRRTSPLVQSSLYLKLAQAYAECGQEAEARAHLQLAHTYFPDHPEDDPSFLYGDFGRSSFFLWEGLTLLALARHGFARAQEAWEVFAQVENPDPAIITSERNHTEIINYQAQTAVALGDFERFYTYLERGIEGAKRLGSKRRRQEAVDGYWMARKQWPHEEKIFDLAELFIS